MPGLSGRDEEFSGVQDMSGPADAGGRATLISPNVTANSQEVPAQLY